MSPVILLLQILLLVSGAEGSAAIDETVFLLRTLRADEATKAAEGLDEGLCQKPFLRAWGLRLLGKDAEARAMLQGAAPCPEVPAEFGDSLFHDSQRGSRGAEKLWLLRQGQLVEDKPEKAEETSRALLVKYPCSKEAQAVLADWKKELSARERFQRALSFISCDEYGSALELLEKLQQEKAPGLEDAVNWELGMLRLRKLRQDPDKALANFEALAGSPKYKDEALYMSARSNLTMERYDAAAVLYQKYLKVGTRKGYREQAQYYLAWMPFDHGEWAASIPLLDRYLKLWPHGTMKSYVLWFKAWADYKLKRWDRMLKDLEPLTRYKKDIVGGKALYWQGVAQKNLGRDDEARKSMQLVTRRWPLTWYGMLAWQRLSQWSGKEEPWLFLDDWREEFSDLAGPGGQAPTLQTGLSRIFALARLGQTDLARDLWMHSPLAASYRRIGAQTQYLSELLELPQHFRDKVSRGQLTRLPAFGGNPWHWFAEYPRAYWRLVEPEARLRGITPYFVVSIMRQESRYRPGVVSWARAVGLMQLIWPTGKRIAEGEGLSIDKLRLFEEAVNIRLASAYLSGLLKEFKGSYVLAAQGYNSGAPAVKRFLGRKNQGIDEAVEDFAYNEGRNYCRKVVGHLLTYLYLYTDPQERRAALHGLLPQEVPRDFPGTVDF